MNKSITLCKFSPLKTPKDKKFKGRQSDTESNCSNVTEDIRNIAKAVTTRFVSEKSTTNLSSDDDLFLSQTFPASPEKPTVPSKSRKKSKKKHKASKDESADSQDSYVTALTSQPVSDRSDTSSKKKKSHKRDKPHGEDDTNSSILLESDFEQKEEMGSLSSGAEMIGERTSHKKKLSKKSKKRKRSHHMSSSDNDVTNTSELAMRSPAKKVRFTEQDDEHLNAVSKSGGKKGHNYTTPSEVESSETDDDDTLEKSADVDISFFGDRAKYEFKTPENFETMDLKHCFTKSELRGKKLFLIQAPKQFDITALKNQKISLSSSSIITDNKGEGKQYEVTPREYDTKKGSGIYSLVVDKNSLTVGESIQGHLQITDWYPGIPPVIWEKLLPRKHRVEGIDDDINTDDVRSKNVETEEVESKKQKKKKKEKKKNKKKKDKKNN